MAFGQSFAPLGQMDDEERRRRMNGAGRSPAQAPVQTLGLRLPRVMGANSPVPQALLTSPGASGVMGGGNPLLTAILQAVMGRVDPGTGGQPPQPVPPSMPTARPPMPPTARPPVGEVQPRPPMAPPQRGGIDSGGPTMPPSIGAILGALLGGGGPSSPPMGGGAPTLPIGGGGSGPVPRFVVENQAPEQSFGGRRGGRRA